MATDAELDKWKGIWGTDRDDHGVVEWPSLIPAFAPLSVEQLRSASGALKWRTSVGMDCIHPRMYSLMPDGALVSLAGVMCLVEEAGAMPSVCKMSMLFTQKKKEGSHRLLGYLPTIYRVWTQARLDLVREWDRANPRDYFWAGEDKGAAMAVVQATAQ